MKTTKLGKWAIAGLIAAALAAPLPALAAAGDGKGPNPQAAQTRQIRPDCPNNGQRLFDGSGRTRNNSLHQNRGAGLRDGSGRGFRGAGLRNGNCDGSGRGPVRS